MLYQKLKSIGLGNSVEEFWTKEELMDKFIVYDAKNFTYAVLDMPPNPVGYQHEVIYGFQHQKFKIDIDGLNGVTECYSETDVAFTGDKIVDGCLSLIINNVIDIYFVYFKYILTIIII